MRFYTRRVPSRRLQRAREYPVLAGQTLNDRGFPVWAAPLKSNRVSFERKLQRNVDLSGPLSPKPTPTEQLYESPQAHRVEFDRRRQLIHGFFPAFPRTPATSEGYPAWLSPKKSHRVEFTRNRQRALVPHVFPPTPPPTPTDPANIRRVNAIRRDSRKKQFTEITYLSVIIPFAPKPGVYPSWVPPQANRVEFRRRKPVQPPLALFSPTTNTDYPSWIGTKAHRLSQGEYRPFRTEALPSYPATPVELYPAWARPVSHRMGFARQALSAIQPPRFQKKPEVIDPAALFRTHTLRSGFDRRPLPRVEPPLKPATALSRGYPAWVPPRVKRVAFERSHVRAIELPVKPLTLAVEEFPSWIPPKANRVAFERSRLSLRDAPVRLSVKSRPILVDPRANHVAFSRTLQRPVDAPSKPETEFVQAKDIVAFRTRFRSETAYCLAAVQSSAYTKGEMDDGAHTLTILRDQTLHVSGDITDKVYTQGDFNL